ncbi:unnamed protein product [Rhizopus stolonifer]
MAADYFYHTPAKNWQIIDAIAYYDEKKSFDSLYSILITISRDLNTVKSTQLSLKKFVKVALDNVEKLLDLKIYQRAISQEDKFSVASASDAALNSTSAAPPASASIPTSQQTTKHMEKLSDIINNNGQLNISPVNATLINNKVLGKRRADEVNETVPALSDKTCLSGSRSSEINITEGSSKYHMMHPTTSLEHPHKPKLRKLHINALRELFHFGTSFSTSNTTAATQYEAYENEQKRNKSLQSLNVLDHVVFMLNEIPYEEFNGKLWTTEHDSLAGSSKAFNEILRYTLCSFHLIYRTVSSYMVNHERSYFIENIIPSLLALAKNTGFVEFKWCETEFCSKKTLNLSEYDYDLRSAPSSKFTDALGTLTTQNNMELVIVEASSGRLREHTTHTIEDSLKILECGVAALKKESIHFKNASLETFKKLKVYSFHVIKTQVTLSEMYLSDKDHWKFVEKRSATLPNNWRDRLGLIQYLELLATLYNDVLSSQLIQKELLRENLGLVSFNGPTIESICKKKSLCFDSNNLENIIRHHEC